MYGVVDYGSFLYCTTDFDTRAGDGVPQHLGDVEEEKCALMDLS